MTEIQADMLYKTLEKHNWLCLPLKLPDSVNNTEFAVTFWDTHPEHPQLIRVKKPEHAAEIFIRFQYSE